MHCKGKSCTNLTSEGKISTLNALHNNDNILHFARIVLLSLFYFACFFVYTFNEIRNVFIHLILRYHMQVHSFSPSDRKRYVHLSQVSSECLQ